MREKSKKTTTMDMTQGPIWKLLLLFAAPLLLGNLFQQLYNTVDSMIVGNFVGMEALAAVGASTTMCNTLVNFFNGVSIGAGVVISNYFGAHDNKNLHEAVQTTMLVSFLIGIAVTAISVPVVPFLLRITSTPEDVLPAASIYLHIYFFGVLFLFTYNMGSSILRAVGDTKRPLYFLITSSLANIALDLVFVLGLHWGVAGVAIATVLSEALSAFLVCHALTCSTEAHRMVWAELRLNGLILKRIISIGLPVGIQQSLTAFANTFVQSYINFFGSSAMAGWSCHLKLDQFAILPAQSIGNATTTFVGQNLGAGKPERAHEGIGSALRMGTIYLLAVSVLMFVGARPLVQLFSNDPSVLYYGAIFISLAAPFRFASAWNQVYAGALRGGGEARASMFIMLFSFAACRQLYLLIITHFFNNIYTVGLSYPVGWIICAILSRCYYTYSYKKKQALAAAVQELPPKEGDS